MNAARKAMVTEKSRAEPVTAGKSEHGAQRDERRDPELSNPYSFRSILVFGDAAA